MSDGTYLPSSDSFMGISQHHHSEYIEHKQWKLDNPIKKEESLLAPGSDDPVEPRLTFSSATALNEKLYLPCGALDSQATSQDWYDKHYGSQNEAGNVDEADFDLLKLNFSELRVERDQLREQVDALNIALLEAKEESAKERRLAENANHFIGRALRHLDAAQVSLIDENVN
ncbi:hypothetical protein C8J57DRAFT_1252825 [Mycena rebaudengoi]|nr:hypothetical protein C8J57DRAFT_1252825 [Mycena rebaudengoi]